MRESCRINLHQIGSVLTYDSDVAVPEPRASEPGPYSENSQWRPSGEGHSAPPEGREKTSGLVWWINGDV